MLRGTLRFRWTARLAAFGLALPAAAAQAQAPVIEHKAVNCIVAERFPRLDACFAPPEQVARARVFFRAQGTPHWYFVDMDAQGPCHSAVLPRPKKSTNGIDYYIDVVDRTFTEGRTPEHHPRVVDSSGECERKMVIAAGLGSTAAAIVLGVAGGAPPIPVGFDSAGIAGAPAPGTPVAQAKSGGGGGTAAAFIIGAAAAGGAAYYLTQKDEEGTTAPSYDGAWAGTTSQNRPFTFTVAQNAVVTLDTSYLAGSAAPIPIQRTFSPGLPITNGSFSLQEQGLVLTGTFASETSASGRLEPTRVTATWQATRR
jgi:hypothetical protein